MGYCVATGGDFLRVIVWGVSGDLLWVIVWGVVVICCGLLCGEWW